ncbi:MAG: METTL5 family protein [Candidatus Jordarchaeales archaeon]
MVKVKLKRKHLELFLERLEDTPSPKVWLEQYPTHNRVAATLLFMAAYVFNDIERKVVYDLGCGNGKLALGAALLGARRVVGVDIDLDALKVAKRNAEKVGVEDRVEWVSMNLKDLRGKADTVVQNPPFGVQRRFSDRIFLEKALEVADVVYSIHKGNFKVRQFIKRFVEERGGYIDQLVTVKLPIPAMFDFHSKKFHVVEVDVYRILKINEKEVFQSERGET